MSSTAFITALRSSLEPVERDAAALRAQFAPTRPARTSARRPNAAQCIARLHEHAESVTASVDAAESVLEHSGAELVRLCELLNACNHASLLATQAKMVDFGYVPHRKLAEHVVAAPVPGDVATTADAPCTPERPEAPPVAVSLHTPTLADFGISTLALDGLSEKEDEVVVDVKEVEMVEKEEEEEEEEGEMVAEGGSMVIAMPAEADVASLPAYLASQLGEVGGLAHVTGRLNAKLPSGTTELTEAVVADVVGTKVARCVLLALRHCKRVKAEMRDGESVFTIVQQ